MTGLSAHARPEAITIFAFDDVTIPFKQNLHLTMAPARKYPGNPVLPHGPEGSPDGHRAQFYGSVIRVSGKYRMWYCAEDRESDPVRSSSFRPAYAESQDGIRWSKPELGLVEYRGNKRNNLLLFLPTPHFELTEPLASFVLYEPEDPNPGHRYKMALYGRFFDAADTGHKNYKSTIYPYFSADGLRWNLATPPPKGLAYDETEAPFPVKRIFEIGGLYQFGGLYYVAGQEDVGSIWMPDGKPAGRAMVTHWSSDFAHWSHDHALSFRRYGYRSKQESLNEAHEPAAVWNRNNVLLATYGLWQGSHNRSELRMPLGLLISNDGISFREPQPDFPLVSPGETGAWDQHGLIHGQGFENVGEETRIYYGSWDLSSAGDPPGSVGLATLRRDGFGYLAVHGEGSAMLTTIPLAFPRGAWRMLLNADGLSPDARLRVEILDPRGALLSAGIVERDGVAQPVQWTQPLPAGAGPYRVRIRFEGTRQSAVRLYAAYVE
jgi:hypothetical protein